MGWTPFTALGVSNAVNDDTPEIATAYPLPSLTPNKAAIIAQAAFDANKKEWTGYSGAFTNKGKPWDEFEYFFFPRGTKFNVPWFARVIYRPKESRVAYISAVEIRKRITKTGLGIKREEKKGNSVMYFKTPQAALDFQFDLDKRNGLKPTLHSIVNQGESQMFSDLTRSDMIFGVRWKPKEEKII